ncbi:MAG: hypothetical protein H6P99_2485 [Holophagaceae bacterium]|nr:hypothetical protein [Holophagaceae bacterium]
MSHEIPAALEACVPGVVHVCVTCGTSVVDAVVTPGEPFRCVDCRGLVPPPADELTRMALEDRGPFDVPDDRPTVWRLVVVLLFAVTALCIVFWKR